jgi:hypothetical protein
MKTLTLFLIISLALMADSTYAQKYLGKDWLKVQFELGAKKANNSKLYVELADRDTVHHVCHSINLVENDESKNREWILIQTYFNDNGICYLEIYTDLQSKEKALHKALMLLPGCKIVYSSSVNHGLMDKYVVIKNNKLLEDIDLQIGSTEDLPKDIMVILGNNKLK